MVTYVLDASPLLRFLDEEVGADRVGAIFQQRAEQETRVVISAVQWGEVAVVLCRRDLIGNVPHILLGSLAGAGVEVIAASAGQAAQAGILQCTLKLPYADAFVVTLAHQLGSATVVTADYDLLVAEHFVPIEILPRKPK